ncbi:MAG TPA: nuclear transport factor 2 family protein [Dermatophilaceae bacterium]|nr:nuclear transport factor 2 family protein [Dermatophilaceae bacterium]
MADVMSQLLEAMNRHDASAVAAHFATDYRSEQPLHPGRGFGGSQQVRANWSSVFAGVPDFVAERIASATDGDTVWTEMRWHGTHLDGSPFLMGGVIVVGVRDGKIAWARLYMEPVEQEGSDIEAAVQQLYRPPSAPNQTAGG